MPATRVRLHLFAPGVEWLVAIVFLVGTLAVAVLIALQLVTTSSPHAPGRAVVDSPEVPAAVPANAIGVTTLLLPDGGRLQIGDPRTQLDRLLRGATVESSVEDRGALGPRLTRAYSYRGTRFVVVLEPFELKGEPRIASLYLR